MEPVAATDRELVSQIRSYFNNLNITEKDLKNPTRALVVEFYKLVLFEFGIDTSNVLQTQGEQFMYLENNVEMVNDITPLINLTAAIKWLKIPYFNDFSIIHLLSPMPKVTSNYMAHIMNFLFFADSDIAELLTKFEKVSERKATKNRLEAYVDQLRKNIAQSACELKKQREETKDMEHEIVMISRNLTELDIEKEEWQKQNEIVKAKLNTVKAAYDEHSKDNQVIENDIREFQNQLKELKGLQSSSEDDSQLSIEVLQMKADNLEEKCNELRTRLTACQDSYELHAQREEQHSGLHQNLEQTVKLIKQNHALSKSLSQIVNKMATTKETIKSLESSRKLLMNKCEQLEENLLGMKCQWSMQESSLKQSVESAQKENKSEIEKFSEFQRQVKENDLEIEELNKKIAQNEENLDKLTDAYEKQYASDCKAVIDMESNLLPKLENEIEKIHF